jgi:DNA-3-methyladenine glycosylase
VPGGNGVRPLPRSFFTRPAIEVAPDLVGKLLVRHDDGLVARLVEVEAYMQHEPACHAHRGRTPRTAPLYGPGGHAYVYFSYGMHWMLNIATGPAGSGQGCLLRAAEPLEGLDCMRRRRGGVADRDLLRGPGRLAQAFGLDRDWSGRDVCGRDPDHPLGLADDGDRPEIVNGPRVGVSQAADLPWRYRAAGSPWISSYKRSPRAPVQCQDG